MIRDSLEFKEAIESFIYTKPPVGIITIIMFLLFPCRTHATRVIAVMALALVALSGQGVGQVIRAESPHDSFRRALNHMEPSSTPTIFAILASDGVKIANGQFSQYVAGQGYVSFTWGRSTDDGATWRPIPNFSPGDYYSISSVARSKRLVICSTSGWVTTSIPDDKGTLGTTWTSRSITNGAPLPKAKIFFGGGKFRVFSAAYAGDTSTNIRRTDLHESDDGVTWTSGGKTSGRVTQMVYGNNRYVSISLTSTEATATTDLIETSTDGTAWTETNIATLMGSRPTRLAFGMGKFILVLKNNQIVTSADGMTWSNPTYIDGMTDQGSVTAVECEDDVCVISYLARNTTSQLFVSDDNVSWSPLEKTLNLFVSKVVRFDTGVHIFGGYSGSWNTLQMSSIPLSRLNATIVTQPVDVAILEGEMATLSVTMDDVPVSFQWIRFGTYTTDTSCLPGYPSGYPQAMNCVTGETSAQLRVPSTEAGQYAVLVRSRSGSFRSQQASVTVTPTAPIITTQPNDQTAIIASSLPSAAITLSVKTSNLAATYQWYRGVSGDTSSPLVGATQASVPLNVSSTGNYWVRLLNTVGSTDSRTVTVTIHPLALTSPTASIGSGYKEFSITGTVPEGSTIEWIKDGETLAGEEGTKLIINAATASHAGRYRSRIVSQGISATTNDLRYDYSELGSSYIEQGEGESMTLVCNAAGPDLSFQWLHGSGQILAENTHFQGTQSRRLTIDRLTASDIGTFICRVSNGLEVANKSFKVGMHGKPVLTFPDRLWFVGTPVQSERIETPVVGDGLVIAVSGLPPGVTYSKGIFSGRPTKIGTYNLMIQGRNAYGSGPAINSRVTVSGFDGNRQGTFSGLVDSDNSLNNGLGGRLSVTITAMGIFTGSITNGATTKPLKGSLWHDWTDDHAKAEITLPSSAGTPATRLTLAIGRDGILIGKWIGEDSQTELRAIRSPWTSSLKATAMAGVHIAALSLDSRLIDALVYPQGTGYFGGAVSAGGVFTASARLADNTLATAAVTIGMDGSIPLYWPLYGGTGSAHGWIRMGSQTMDGHVVWAKKPQGAKSTTRSYNDGFPPHSLQIRGGRMRIYSPGQIVMGLPSNSHNAVVSLASPSSYMAVTLPITITPANLVVMPNSSPLSLAIDRVQSKFTGTASIGGRVGHFYGIFVDQVGWGVGHVQMPESALPNAKLLSKSIAIQPVQ